MRLILALFLYLSINSAWSQIPKSSNVIETEDKQFQIQGKLIDQNSGEPIPYAHIYQWSVFGITTNDSGRYSLMLDTLNKETSITITAIGYQTLHLKADFFFQSTFKEISLKRKSYPLDEIEITPDSTDSQIQILGYNYSKKVCNLRYLASVPFQVGTVLQIPQNSALKYAEVYILRNKYAKHKFRLRIYGYDNEKDSVLEEISSRQLIGQLKKGRKGWAKIDLSSDNIYLSSGYILIAFESVYQGEQLFYTELIKTKQESLTFELYGPRILNCYDTTENRIKAKTFLKDYSKNHWNIISDGMKYSNYPLIRLGLR